MAKGIFIEDESNQRNLLVERQSLFNAGKKYIPVCNQKTADKIDTLDIDASVFINDQYSLPNLKNVKFLRDDVSMRYGALAETKIEHIEFPADAKLDGRVLYQCKMLKSVVFPMNMTVIPDEVCMHASNLASVQFGDDVQEFGQSCFWGCEKLELQIPKTVYRIGFGAMKGVGNSELIIPESCKYVGPYAFADMLNLKEVVIENPQMRIDFAAFGGCSGVKIVQIGENVYPAKIIDADLAIILNTEQLQWGVILETYRHLNNETKYYYASYGDGSCYRSKNRSEAIQNVIEYAKSRALRRYSR